MENKMELQIKRTEELLQKCRRILREEHIPVTEHPIDLTINSRVRSRFGKCTKTGNRYSIELSGYLMETEDRTVETVLLHELLHTCPGCLNHGKRWKAHAEKVNQKYGYNITATTSYEKMGMADPGSRETVKYLVKCSSCGLEIPRKRKCRLVENVDRYRCGKCGGKLKIH